jgi:hypothetical protein
MLNRTFGCVRVVWSRTRAGRQSAHYTRSAFAMRGGELRLAKTSTPLRFVWSWPDVDLTALNPAIVIVSREPDGRWYVTFTVDTTKPEPLPETGHAIGVDLGVKDFAVTSDGEKIANPRAGSCQEASCRQRYRQVKPGSVRRRDVIVSGRQTTVGRGGGTVSPRRLRPETTPASRRPPGPRGSRPARNPPTASKARSVSSR